jgi:hypothetical protein
MWTTHHFILNICVFLHYRKKSFIRPDMPGIFPQFFLREIGSEDRAASQTRLKPWQDGPMEYTSLPAERPCRTKNHTWMRALILWGAPRCAFGKISFAANLPRRSVGNQWPLAADGRVWHNQRGKLIFPRIFVIYFLQVGFLRKEVALNLR